MIFVSARLNVSDYAKWRTTFDSTSSDRKTGGATGVNHIYRDVENPSTVTAIMEWNTIENARAHIADPKVQETLKNAGVTGAPEFRYFNHA